MITYLGPDTPTATIRETLAELEPRLIVITAMTRQRLRAAQAQLTELTQKVPVALAGPGATETLAHAIGASLLEGDPLTAAGTSLTNLDDPQDDPIYASA